MTLSVAWVKQVGTGGELYVASDSRLRWGRAWDCCPKILPLARQDSVLCFAGETEYAYPFMLQIQSAIRMHQKSLSRAQDLTEVRGHILRVINDMRQQVYDFAPGLAEEPPDVSLMLCGYSWKVSAFKIWTLHFKSPEKRFVFRSASSHKKQTKGTKYFHFVGDHTREASHRLLELLRSRRRLTRGGLHMEPFEVLVEMIRDREYESIGGPPQVMKVYRHMNCMPVNVYWPDRAKGSPTYLGRRLLNYEVNSFPVLDPDTLTTESRFLQALESAETENAP